MPPGLLLTNTDENVARICTGHTGLACCSLSVGRSVPQIPTEGVASQSLAGRLTRLTAAWTTPCPGPACLPPQQERLGSASPPRELPIQRCFHWAHLPTGLGSTGPPKATWGGVDTPPTWPPLGPLTVSTSCTLHTTCVLAVPGPVPLPGCPCHHGGTESCWQSHPQRPDLLYPVQRCFLHHTYHFLVTVTLLWSVLWGWLCPQAIHAMDLVLCRVTGA